MKGAAPVGRVLLERRRAVGAGEVRHHAEVGGAPRDIHLLCEAAWLAGVEHLGGEELVEAGHHPIGDAVQHVPARLTREPPRPVERGAGCAHGVVNVGRAGVHDVRDRLAGDRVHRGEVRGAVGRNSPATGGDPFHRRGRVGGRGSRHLSAPRGCRKTESDDARRPVPSGWRRKPARSRRVPRAERAMVSESPPHRSGHELEPPAVDLPRPRGRAELRRRGVTPPSMAAPMPQTPRPMQARRRATSRRAIRTGECGADEVRSGNRATARASPSTRAMRSVSGRATAPGGSGAVRSPARRRSRSPSRSRVRSR